MYYFGFGLDTINQNIYINRHTRVIKTNSPFLSKNVENHIHHKFL